MSKIWLVFEKWANLAIMSLIDNAVGLDSDAF